MYISPVSNMPAMQLPLVICHLDTVLLQDAEGPPPPQKKKKTKQKKYKKQKKFI